MAEPILEDWSVSDTLGFVQFNYSSYPFPGFQTAWGSSKVLPLNCPLAMQQWHGVGVLEEVFPLLVFNSLAVLELVVPWAFGFGGGVPSEDTEAGFFPCHEQSSGWCLLPKHSLHTFPCFFRSPVWQLARGTYCYCYCYCYCYWGA
jgi:hypothetical protein